jgi:hypothetical protein
VNRLIKRNFIGDGLIDFKEGALNEFRKSNNTYWKAKFFHSNLNKKLLLLKKKNIIPVNSILMISAGFKISLEEFELINNAFNSVDCRVVPYQSQHHVELH